ncbi:MAG: hypothetical protein Q9171_001200 [Xanthocarpia ochracea]
MDPTLSSRPKTFRIQNIAPGTTAEDLKKLFYTEHQPCIEVRSIAPAVDSHEFDIRHYTATVLFHAPNPTVETPRLCHDDIDVDSEFHGFTPLNHPQEPIAAELLAMRDTAKALCDINGTIGRYSSRLPVRSIIFLGAPHKGLHTAALEALVKSKPTADMLSELKAGSPTLTELNEGFKSVAQNLDILTCYETRKSRTAIQAYGSWKREGQEEMMVSFDSARQYHPRERCIASDTDHSHIAKLKRGENGIYPDIRSAIKKAMLSVGDLYTEADGHHNLTTMHQAYGSYKPSDDQRRMVRQLTISESQNIISIKGRLEIQGSPEGELINYNARALVIRVGTRKSLGGNWAWKSME